jgi:hypothetical protein
MELAREHELEVFGVLMKILRDQVHAALHHYICQWFLLCVRALICPSFVSLEHAGIRLGVFRENLIGQRGH